MPSRCNQLLADFLRHSSIRRRGCGIPPSVDLSITACDLWALVLIYRRWSDEDNSRAVCEDRGMGDDGDKVFAVAI